MSWQPVVPSNRNPNADDTDGQKETDDFHKTDRSEAADADRLPIEADDDTRAEQGRAGETDGREARGRKAARPACGSRRSAGEEDQAASAREAR